MKETIRAATQVVGWRGWRAVIGVAIAVVGALEAANPGSAFLRALREALPALGDAIPPLITACGALIAAYSQPPRLRE